MNIAILGGGPAGLMAAWACLERGHRPTLFDRFGVHATKRLLEGQGDVSAGVFLLHEDCHLIQLQPRMVTYGTIGQGFVPAATLEASYRRKVYGGRWEGEVSLTKYRETRVDYDGLQAVRLLVDYLHDCYDDDSYAVDGASIQELLDGGFERVVSTVPLPAYLPDVPWTGQQQAVHLFISTSPAEEGWVQYAPTNVLPWYRASAVFGRFALEYPAAYPLHKPFHDVRKLTEVTKPLAPGVEGAAFMQSYGQNVLFAGRFGRWEKGIEQHDVYASVSAWLEGR